MDRLKGKIAIVTGAASGIGAASVRLFVEEGARVLAVDIDSAAAGVAAEVVRANEVEDVVAVRAGSAEARRSETFDGVVANIQSSYFLAHANDIAQALNPGGVLVASGLLDEDVAELGGALASCGLVIETINADGPWVCAVARRAS